jgi:glycerol-3-phosphate dehydrogenase (NAD(P)+)
VRALGIHPDPFGRSDLVFLAVPSQGIGEVVAELRRLGVSDRAGIISLAKGLVPPDGTPPVTLLESEFGPERVACVGGYAHAGEMVEAGAGLVCASRSEALAHRVADDCFQQAGVVCEVSDDPTGVELAGVAKNAAAVAVGATQAQGLNAAGMAAADIFLEALALASPSGGQARTFVGRAGTGDLVATALAASSRNRSAGELLEAPVVSALARLIEGSLPLDEWVAMVRRSSPCRPPSAAPARGGRGCAIGSPAGSGSAAFRPRGSSPGHR